MTRMIKAHRRYRIVVDIMASGEGELIVVAPDEGMAEDIAQQSIDTGAFRDFLKENNPKKFNLDISITNIEDIGNAITGE